jgi:hypothetical protein
MGIWRQFAWIMLGAVMLGLVLFLAWPYLAKLAGN